VHEYLVFSAGNWELVAALGIILALIVADELQRRLRALHELEPAQAVRLINRGVILVDCRTQADYARAHLAGARHIPLAELPRRLDELKPKRTKKSRPILVIGGNSRHSARALTILRRAGLTDSYSLKGGIEAWRREQLPLEKAT